MSSPQQQQQPENSTVKASNTSARPQLPRPNPVTPPNPAIHPSDLTSPQRPRVIIRRARPSPPQYNPTYNMYPPINDESGTLSPRFYAAANPRLQPAAMRASERVEAEAEMEADSESEEEEDNVTTGSPEKRKRPEGFVSWADRNKASRG